MKTIDLSELSSLCSTSRSEALKNIFSNLKSGEKVKLVTRDSEISYAIRNLGESYGYKVIEFEKDNGIYKIIVEKI